MTGMNKKLSSKWTCLIFFKHNWKVMSSFTPSQPPLPKLCFYWANFSVLLYFFELAICSCSGFCVFMTSCNFEECSKWLLLACVAGDKRGGRGGREKSAKEGKREGNACYKCQCFCILPTIFWNNPIMSTDTWPITSRALLSVVWTFTFI